MNSLEQDEEYGADRRGIRVSSRNGCPDNFRLLVQRYQRPLFAYLSSRWGIIWRPRRPQESFVRAFMSLKKLRKPESFYAWLMGIAGQGPQGAVPCRGTPPEGPHGGGDTPGGEFRHRAGVPVERSHRRPARVLSSGDPAAVYEGALRPGAG